jgi:hypothetical protein
MIKRFPREEALHAKGEKNAFSMNDVHDGLWKLAAGKEISPRRTVLLRRWFGLDVVISKEIAAQIITQLKNGEKKIKIRFPRRENGNRSR